MPRDITCHLIQKSAFQEGKAEVILDNFRLYASLDGTTLPLYLDERGEYAFVPMKTLSRRMWDLYGVKMPNLKEVEAGFEIPLYELEENPGAMRMAEFLLRFDENDQPSARTRFKILFMKERLSIRDTSAERYSYSIIATRKLKAVPKSKEEILSHKVTAYSLRELQDVFSKRCPMVAPYVTAWVPSFEDVVFTGQANPTPTITEELIEHVIYL